MDPPAITNGEVQSSSSLKELDSAIMEIGPKPLTRYAKKNLLELKNSKYSQYLPVCLTKARIARLDIFVENQTKPMPKINIMPLLPNFPYQDKNPMPHFPQHKIHMPHFQHEHKIENGATKRADNGKVVDAPEWYNWPASRQDFIDLHGFEDDELFRPKAALPKDKEGLNDNADKNAFDQFMARENKTQASQIRSSYQNHHRCDVRSHNVDSKRFQTPMQDPNYSPNIMPNAFYEAWKRQDQMEHINFVNWQKAQGPMMTINEVEKGYGQAHVPNHQPSYPNNPAVPQFFRNAANVFPNQGFIGRYPNPQGPPIELSMLMNAFQSGRIPTHEQLIQHTSEIMRNAMLRKMRQNEHPK